MFGGFSDISSLQYARSRPSDVQVETLRSQESTGKCAKDTKDRQRGDVLAQRRFAFGCRAVGSSC